MPDPDSLPLNSGEELPPTDVQVVGAYRILYYRDPLGRAWESLRGPVVHEGLHGTGTALFLVLDDGTRKWAGMSWAPTPSPSGWISEN